MPEPASGDDPLRRAFREFFGAADDGLFELCLPDLTLVPLAPGGVLISEGDRSNDVFFVVSGRLRAIRGTQVQVLGEIVRGETVGELGLITGERRSATVLAVRETLVARMTRRVFNLALAGRPDVAVGVMRTVIARFRRDESGRRAVPGRRTLCLLPITPGARVRGLPGRLLAALQRAQPYATLIAAADVADGGDGRGEHVHAAEARASTLLLLADPAPSAWTEFCIGRADEILLLADADAEPAVSEAEARLLDRADTLIRPAQTLVLLHDAARRSPTGTARWLARREVARHLHIRPDLDRDLDRLGRMTTGRGIGLVLSGGGARGFAHIGVMRALEEAGIEPDVIGGTSIGSVMGAWRAMDVRGEDLVRAGRRAFVESGGPTTDYNLLPLVSLIKGRKTRAITEAAVREAAGSDIMVEDTWTTYFCIAGDFSNYAEIVLDRGPLAKSILASYAIPGALPPIVLGGRLMIDGGTVNNLPVDVMARQGVGTIIAVDLLAEVVRRIEFDWVPGSFALLLDWFRERRKRRFDMPSLGEILVDASFLQSNRRQREMRDLADICFHPNLADIRMLQWRKYDEAVRIGYEHARARLGELDSDLLAKCR